MADVSISYKGNEIASMNATGVKTLLTSSAFCEDDITVTYTKPSAPVPSLQTKSATYTPSTSQQTASITADAGYDALGEVNVTVEGIVCTNLTAENIADGVTVKIGTATDDDSVASVTGTHQGGGGGAVTITLSKTTNNFDNLYAPSSATVETDPDSPWITYIRNLPANSLIVGLASTSVFPTCSTGITCVSSSFGTRPTWRTYAFTIGDTDGSIAI